MDMLKVEKWNVNRDRGGMTRVSKTSDVGSAMRPNLGFQAARLISTWGEILAVT